MERPTTADGLPVHDRLAEVQGHRTVASPFSSASRVQRLVERVFVGDEQRERAPHVRLLAGTRLIGPRLANGAARPCGRRSSRTRRRRRKLEQPGPAVPGSTCPRS